MESIRTAPKVVITGAGISMDAGLPSGPALVESALVKLSTLLGMPSESVGRLSGALPLEVFFQVVADHAGKEIATRVTHALDADKPTPVHAWLAHQINEGRLTHLYTFNFDTLHEVSLGLPMVRSKSGRTVVLNSKDGRFRLTKLHGSADSEGVVSMGEYVQGFTETIRSGLLDTWHDQEVLILGYGGWDADLAVTIDEAVAKRKLPRKVIWVDHHFPKHGGRTAMLSDLELAGVVCQRVTGDLYSVLAMPEARNALPRHDPFRYAWEEFDAMDHTIVAAIIAESALLAGEWHLATSLLDPLTESARLRLNGLLLDRQQSDRVLEAYRKLLESDGRGTTAALAAANIYSHTQGQEDRFDQVDLSSLPASIAEHYGAYIASRRTDLGGLNRSEAAMRVRHLPKPFETAQAVESLDTVRLYVSLLSESARLLHEASDYENALVLDKRAYRFAAALGDVALKASVSGGMGACFMGMADTPSEDQAVSMRKQAVHWLRETLAADRSDIGDYTWGLAMCNLGSVLSELGEPTQGIECLKKGLPALQQSMPNWAVSAWAYLAGAYGDLFQQTWQEADLALGFQALADGHRLADSLDDQDDAYLLERERSRLRALLQTLQ